METRCVPFEGLRTPSRPRVKIILATMFVILCWAYSPIGIRIGLQAYEPGQLALMRFLIASAFMALVAMGKGISRPRLRDLPLLVVLGFFAVSLHHIALNYGQRGVSAGAASVLAQSTPLFSTLLAHVVFKDRVSGWQWGCVMGGLLGAAVVVTGDRGFGDMDAHGLLILLAALSWSVYFFLQKRHSHRYDGLTMVCYTVWSGTLLLFIFAPGMLSAARQASAPVNLAVLILGIFPCALAYLAWAYVLAHRNVSRASMALYLIPPSAMLMATLVLAERPSAMVIVGAVIVLVSVFALSVELGNGAKVG
ncbi:DMT family transporter [Pseudomonas fluorescens]|uniref:DMT family transporter n=1 Tax=Pseudomonas fluorescens TaxID=294 RepID=A0A944DKA7_PSEFL|nr:DMT family transporter [Pseudomonas fluorescens]MBT2295615.1 DMT family transporter [Pseudomonas fluorescens]MBT2310485.1 DMT family transporter [Pseudomonas fluorescens]MBT2313993.1 DMT family transporter [Pseudomonas fluorescens]MBT2318709.1 DMT family transporter [Pseudomonas fluorescens]MBT2329513.1 DMT family transporter [Pseudomonas fluorescens]